MDDSYWWSWYGMWAWMGPITKATVVLMGFMLLCAIYNFLKQVESRPRSRDCRRFHTGDFATRSDPLSESIVCRFRTSMTKCPSPVVLAGLEAFKSAPNTLADVQAIELAERAMERRESVADLHAQRGLILLDTVTHTAPLVGFFAVMLAITNIFRGTAESVAEYLTFVVNSLAHALCTGADWAGGCGIGGSIPQLYLSRHRKGRCAEWRADSASARVFANSAASDRRRRTVSSRGRCHRDASLWEPIGAVCRLAVVAVSCGFASCRGVRAVKFHGAQ